ncbi:MAG: DUF4352 domain-containing protein [Pirellulales bacterium]|nr:DUF4352 domain-containing protein [Pirellulales bacterium]
MKKAGCGSLLLGAIVFLILFVWVVNSCSEKQQQAQRTELQRRSSLTPEQRQVEEKATTESKAKKEETIKPKVYDEGETVRVGYTTYAVWRSWWSNQLSENPLLNQRPNAMYLFVELTVRNNDKKARMVSPFTLIDDSGAEYEASSNGWAVEGSIGLFDSLNPSVSKQGFVIFDVPQNRNYRLKLSGGYWSLQDAFVQLTPKLSRDDAIRVEQERRDEQTKAEMERQAEQRRQVEKERQEAIEAAKWRTWTNSTGTHKTEAKFGGMAFGKVKLIKRDGSTVQVPLEKLSDEDREWIANRQK